MGERLTAKQQLWVEAFIGVAQGNATEAARIAGYKGNDNTLKQVGSENLAKPYLAELVGKRVEEAAMTANEVLAELADIAKSDWREHLQIQYDKEGNMIGATLRLGDKIKALELVGKHHKLFVDKVEHGGTIQSVQMTLDEWNKQAAQRLQSAEKSLGNFKK